MIAALQLSRLLPLVASLLLAPVSRANETRPGPNTGDRTLSPYFQIEAAADGSVDALPLKDTRVEVTITGVIAEVSILQTYTNEGSTPLNAVYVFPGSTRAAVHALAMRVGDRLVHARIERKAEARRTYEKAKSEGRTASLLEQHRPNVFQMNLANILPGDLVQVELRYTELLEVEESEYEFVFPTVVGPRYSNRTDTTSPQERWVEQPYLPPGRTSGATFDLHAHVAAGVPLAALTCGTHPVRIEQTSPGETHVRLDPAHDPTTHADRDFILRFRLAGDALQAGWLLQPSDGPDGGGYFLAMIQPPVRAIATQVPPRDYILVVDISGSMGGFPLATAQELLRGLVGDLRPDDTFNVLFFAGGSFVLSPTPLAATPENLAAAIVAIEQTRGGGGTELLPALRSALALPRSAVASRTIVVITDGFVDIEAEAFALVRANLGRANLFAFGIGSSVNRHLIEGLARAGQGEPCIVTDAGEAAAAAGRFRKYIESPVLTGVGASCEGLATSDVVPAALPDVFAKRPVILFGKWQGPATGGRIVVSGTHGEGAFAATLDATNAVTVTGSRAVELLWARARITELSDLEGIDRTSERREEITQLGLTHGLLTKYTSFVAVDEIARAPAAAETNVAQPLPLPRGVGAGAVGGHPVPTTPEPAATGLFIITIAALAGVLWHRRARGKRQPL